MKRLLLVVPITAGVFSITAAGAAGLIVANSPATYKPARAESIQTFNSSSNCNNWIAKFTPNLASGKIASIELWDHGETTNDCVDAAVSVVMTPKSGAPLTSSEVVFAIIPEGGKEYAKATVVFTSSDVTPDRVSTYKIMINDAE